MDPADVKKLGKKAFVQSIRPYAKKEVRKAEIFGIDIEYIPRLDEASTFISWQLASKDKAMLSTKRPTLKDLYDQSILMTHSDATIFVYVSYFSLAEIQFFSLDEWEVSEFKGKMHLKQNYDGRTLMIIDLMDWTNPPIPLKDFAKVWGLEKLDFKIGEKVEAIARGEATIKELLDDPDFYDYAVNDAILAQRIYSRMREWFFKYNVDIIDTMTIAQTSACMFRQNLTEPITQHNTDLREMALRCCWGGRMELLVRGEREKVYEYDASGQHPNSAIALGVLPREKDWRRTTKLKEWLSGISGVGRVYFKFPETERYPCLPVFHGDSLLYPLEGTSCCSVTEVRQALAEGASILLLDGYYYSEGTDVLTTYLSWLQIERGKATDEGYRNLLKLLCNSIIGKFFQKNRGVDLQKVQDYARQHKIPMEEAIRMEGVDFGEGKVTVGSCFYPEWYALILGYARATISKVAREHNALVISSDAFTTEEEMPKEWVDSKITYKLKTGGRYVGYRARFYRVGEKLAHHAVHNLQFSKEVLEYYRTTLAAGYVHRRILHLRESWAVKKPFGANVERKMTVYLSYDNKRCLLPDGFDTRPWKTVEERDVYMAEHKAEWDAERKGYEEENGD